MRRVQLIILVLLLVACGGDDDSPETRTRIITATPALQSTVSVPQTFPTATQSFFFPTATTNLGGGVQTGGTTTNCPIPVGWQAYTIQPNDTLSGIAATINSTVDTIQRGNCLTSSDIIYTGSVIYLPSLPVGAPTVAPTIPGVSVPTTTTEGIAAANTNCVPPAGWVPYTVVSGDTLGSLAEQIGSNITLLQSANCLANPELIYVGQTLYLPALPGGSVPATIQPTFTPATGACSIPVGWQPYTILPGDTLGVIAERVGTTVAVIQNGNCLPNADTIYVGQTIYLPIPGATFPTATPTFALLPSLTPTQLDTGTPPRLSQSTPAVRPTQNREDGALVTLQRTIALDMGVVPDADRVVYMALPASGDPTPVQIGVDTDPYDGTRIEYTFNPFDSELYFYAVAENEYGSTASFMVRVVYDPTFVVGSGKPDIFPFIGFDASIYTLEPGRTVTVSWRDAPTDSVRVEFYLAQGGVNELIGTDSDPANGARTLWRVPELLGGQVFARAIFANGTTQDSEPVNVYSETGN